MGATYTRQSSSAIVDGGVIEASDINAEFDQVLAAFAVTSGHTHDGTAAEGGPITKLLGTAITIGDATAGTDIAVTFDGETADGVLTWMEDEDYFKFSDEVLMNSTEKLLFGDTGTYIHQSADGVLDLVSDTEIEINATTIDINGNVDVSGTLTVAGAVDFGDAALSNVGAVQLDSIAGDGDTNTSITFSGSDVITVATGGSGRLTIGDGALSPVTNNQIDLGTASLEFKNAFFDGTVTADAFAGPLTGNVTGNASGTAATVTTAAQSNITSLGTLTTLTVDNVITNGATIGHTSDTDLITLADGIVTVAGEISVTTLDIGGTNVTSDATELNLLDGKAATNLALLGKTEGTNFTGSLLVGHSTSGTLDAATYNTGIGLTALDALTAGDNNTAVGYAALGANSSGTRNTAVGVNALLTNSSGQQNIAIGHGAVDAANNSYNVGVGVDALGVATGTSNTGLGHRAGHAILGGDYNIALGWTAGDNITTGSGNVVIGKADVSSATGDDQLSISDGEDGSVAWITGDSGGNLTFPGNTTIGNEAYLNSDASAIYFGGNTEIALIHVHNEGLNLKHSATADDKPIKFTLQTGETDIAVDDVLGSINFQAPGEAAGTDAILVAAGIEAVSEGDFSSSNNATKLSFKTAASEAAAEKMSLSSGGNLTVSGDISADNFKQEGTNFTGSLLIGHATTGTLNAAENNTGVGIEALDAITSGDDNTAGGRGALTTATTGSQNTAIGRNAAKLLVDGENNVAVGYNSVRTNVSGDRNTGVGSNALYTNSTGDYNTAVGYDGLKLTTGDSNIGLGYRAGDNITTGDGNVIIGSIDADSATGDTQLIIADGVDGSVAWIKGDSSANVVIGGDISADNIKQEGTNFTGSLLIGHATTGTLNAAQSNTGVGINTLDALTSGDENTAVGYNALTVNTTGEKNTAFGSSALKANVSGTDNTAIGKASLIKATGSFNTALGESSGKEIVGGASNIVIGNDSGDNITSGDGNVIIGSINADSATGDKQLIVADGVDGSVAWLKGDSSGMVSANGGQLTTTGKALVMGF